MIGKNKQMMATFRHVVIVPSKKTMKKPNMAATPEQAIKIPRIDGWLLEYEY